MTPVAFERWSPKAVPVLQAYFGFMNLMGVNHLPTLADCWKLDTVFRYSPIADKITRDRFFEISKYSVDNSTLVPRGDPNYDKLGKVRSIDTIREQFLSVYDPHQQNAIDEAMIAFKGRSSMKQYVPKKPIKRGFKAWVRADAVTGYVCEFDIYTGKGNNEREYGLGGSVVKKLAEKLKGKLYTIFCDNFLTSAKLFLDLLVDGIYACGTYNRTRKCYPSDLQTLAKILDFHEGEMLDIGRMVVS